MRFGSKVLESIQTFWKDIPKSRRFGIIVTVLVVVSLSITAAVLLNAKNYQILYTGLTVEEAGEVYQRLTDMAVDTKTRGTGTILVPEGQVDELRMQLAADGYPKSGLTYDLYMENTGLGVTEFDKNNYLRFQLEDRLQNTIATMEGVQQVVVTLGLPEADAYVLETQSQSATASVLLSLMPGIQLTPRQVVGIESLVVKAVPGLTAENVSIVDQYMNVLNDHSGDDSDLSLSDSRLEYETYMRTQLEDEIRSLLEPVFGARNVAVALNLQLDFDKETTETVKYEPVVDDEGIAQDLSELSEQVQNGSDSDAGGVPGISSNGGSSYASSDTQSGSYEQNSKTVHYLVNEIRQEMEKAQGQIKSLSVSVVINQEDTNPQVQQQVQDIVCKATGVDENQVSVQFMAFAQPSPASEIDQPASAQPGLNLSRPTIFIIIGFLLIVAIFVLLLLGMSARQRSIAAEAERLRSALNGEAEPVETEQAVAADSGDEESIFTKESEASILKKLDEMFNDRPDMTARLLRTWMTD